MRPSVPEVLRQAAGAENMEIFDVPVACKPIVLLRAKEMPDCAFVVWSANRSSTASQIAFHLTAGGVSEHYSVVCACCRSEVYGLKPPQDPIMGITVALWLTQQFSEAIADTCRANGITTVFMRKAGCWTERYGDMEGIAVVEAKDWLRTMSERFERQALLDAFKCIDIEASRGMGGE